MLDSIDEFKSNEGSIMNHFLFEVSCNNLSKCDTILDYEKFDVKWQNVELSSSHAPKLSSIRQIVLDALKKEINTYFPEGTLEI